MAALVILSLNVGICITAVNRTLLIVGLVGALATTIWNGMAAADSFRIGMRSVGSCIRITTFFAVRYLRYYVVALWWIYAVFFFVFHDIQILGFTYLSY